MVWAKGFLPYCKSAFEAFFSLFILAMDFVERGQVIGAICYKKMVRAESVLSNIKCAKVTSTRLLVFALGEV